MKKAQPLIILAAGLTLAACSNGGGDTALSKDEQQNFKQGMSADKVKEVGPAPKMASGPGTTNYSHKSAADKAQGF